MKVLFGLTCQSTLFPEIKIHNTTTLTYLKTIPNQKRADYLKAKAQENLKNLPKLIEKCVEQDIHALRINDNLLPLADLGEYDYEKQFKKQLQEIGKVANKYNMYMSYHPSQFFLLTSKNPKTIQNSVKNFNVFARVLGMMKLKNKPVLLTHVGALNCYKNWEEACDAFCQNFKLMSEEAQSFFAVQNDQTCHSIDSCMYIHAKLGIPVVFDHAHYQWNPVKGVSMRQAAKMALGTWKQRMPKVHLCSQMPGMNKHAHSHDVDKKDYLQLKADVEAAGVKECIFMVEVKNKDAAIQKLRQQLASK